MATEVIAPRVRRAVEGFNLVYPPSLLEQVSVRAGAHRNNQTIFHTVIQLVGQEEISTEGLPCRSHQALQRTREEKHG